jgi:plasmid stability protein
MIANKRPQLLLLVVLVAAQLVITLPAGVAAQQDRQFWQERQNFPGRYGANRLTGTYRLDEQASDDVWRAASRATRGMTAEQRDRLRQFITARLTAPEMLAIDQRGRDIVLASTRAPQVSFQADGRDRVEQTPRGRTVRVNAGLIGNQLVFSQTGDRGNDFRVTFEPIEGGRRLRVTRRMDVQSLASPVSVSSIYDRTSEIAQLDLPRESRPDLPAGGPGYPGNGPAFVPAGTDLTGELDQALSTRYTRAGQRFSLRVVEPREYEGAIIEGQVLRSDRPERLSGRADLTLAFDRIQMRNGQSRPFDGYIQGVITPNGEDVRVDSEGHVSEDDTQGERTLTRSGIGAALGAVIGAIAGGGKGAVIGAAVGAGAGAGSVFVQGRDDLELRSGTRIRVQSIAVRNNPY